MAPQAVSELIHLLHMCLFTLANGPVSLEVGSCGMSGFTPGYLNVLVESALSLSSKVFNLNAMLPSRSSDMMKPPTKSTAVGFVLGHSVPLPVDLGTWAVAEGKP